MGGKKGKSKGKKGARMNEDAEEIGEGGRERIKRKKTIAEYERGIERQRRVEAIG